MMEGFQSKLIFFYQVTVSVSGGSTEDPRRIHGGTTEDPQRIHRGTTEEKKLTDIDQIWEIIYSFTLC